MLFFVKKRTIHYSYHFTIIHILRKYLYFLFCRHGHLHTCFLIHKKIQHNHKKEINTSYVSKRKKNIFVVVVVVLHINYIFYDFKDAKDFISFDFLCVQFRFLLCIVRIIYFTHNSSSHLENILNMMMSCMMVR